MGRESRGKEFQEVSRNPPLWKADWGSSRREMRRLQDRTHSWQQKQGKERRLRTEREKPRMKPARTGAWGGLKRTISNQFDELRRPTP